MRWVLTIVLGFCAWASSSKSFLYSLYNVNGFFPLKLQIKSRSQGYAIMSFLYGPTFGSGRDLHISDNAVSNADSKTNCDSSYHLPQGYSLSRTSCIFFTGRLKFTPTDFEVFYETTT